MYSSDRFTRMSADKHLYYTVICGKVSAIYLTDTEASAYRNKYGSLHATRELAFAEIAGGIKFGTIPVFSP